MTTVFNQVSRPRMYTGADGISLMHYFVSGVLTAYPDPATGGDPWTIGYGNTGPEVKKGLRITQFEADAMFANRLNAEFEPAVSTMLRVLPSQKQFDALISLAYNIGVARIRGSTLIRLYNESNATRAADEFLKWNRAAGKPMLGLTRRRMAERALFMGSSASEAIAIGANYK